MSFRNGGDKDYRGGEEYNNAFATKNSNYDDAGGPYAGENQDSVINTGSGESGMQVPVMNNGESSNLGPVGAAEGSPSPLNGPVIDPLNTTALLSVAPPQNQIMPLEAPSIFDQWWFWVVAGLVLWAFI